MKRAPKILIVDDNPPNVELLKTQLKHFPYSLECAYDGEEALDKIFKAPPDLILLDIMMPKISGFEICQRIRAALLIFKSEMKSGQWDPECVKILLGIGHKA